MNENELLVLVEYAKRNGRFWKSMLRKDWEQSRYPSMPEGEWPTLQRLRNANWFGPRGLNKFKH